jgi:hypothetical protein
MDWTTNVKVPAAGSSKATSLVARPSGFENPSFRSLWIPASVFLGAQEHLHLVEFGEV